MLLSIRLLDHLLKAVCTVAAALVTALGLSVGLDLLTLRLADGEGMSLQTSDRPQYLSLPELVQEIIQARFPQSTTDAAAYRALGITYLQKARETGDVSYYGRAEAAFAKALELNPQDPDVMVGLGTLALARHQFQEALTWGEKARELSPTKPTVYGVIGDARIELGQYETAFDTIQRMVDLRPDLASYSRISYARELLGDIQGATRAMRVAAEAGNPTSEATAWARVQLGHLLWTYFAATEEAQREYRYALFLRPDYAPALAGMARIAAAIGDTQEAIALAREAATLMPLPEHIILLGDILRAAGYSEKAAQQDALVRAMDALARSAGIDTDIEIALFEADLGEQPMLAVKAARRGYEQRPNARSADTLAWALYRVEEIEESRISIAQALSLGTFDPLTHYHAAKIAQASGNREAAIKHLSHALSVNPDFSLRYAQDARLSLAALTGGK